MDEFHLIWLVALILFVIAEGVSINLITIWFAFGSLIALIAAFAGAQLWLQIILFFASSILSLVLTRPLIKKFLLIKKTPTNSDRVLGQTGLVREKIDNINEKGSVYVDGKEWSARSEYGQIVETGTLVEILKISGVKLIVKEK